MAEDVFGMYLGELGGIESCGDEENERLLRELALGNQGAKDRLIEGNLKAVLEMVQDYLNRGVAAGDLVQEANMALVMAVGEYERGSFSDFFRGRVKEALEAAVEEQSLHSQTARKVADRVNRLEDVSTELARELGREATVEELARRMELTQEEVKDIMKITLDAMSVAER